MLWWDKFGVHGVFLRYIFYCCILSAMAEFNSKTKKDFILNILSKKDKDYINEKIHNLVSVRIL